MLQYQVAAAQDFSTLQKKIKSAKDNSQVINILTKQESELSLFKRVEQAKYWFLLGKALEEQNSMSKAADAFTQAIELFTNNKLPPSSLLINSLIERSRVVGNINQYNTSACKDKEQALLIARQLGLLNLVAKSIAYYARCLQSEEYGITKSLQLFDEAFKIAENQALTSDIKQIIYNQAATLSFRALLYDKAYEYNMLAYKAYTASNDLNSIYHSILNAVHYSIALIDVVLAKQHLTELDRFTTKNPKFIDAKLKYYYLSAKVAQLEKKWPLSITFLEAGLAEVKHSKNVSYIQATYELLSIAYFRVGDIEKSYQTLAQVAKIYPNKKPIKKEVLLIKGVMNEKPEQIANIAFKLIDKERQLKNNFVKQTSIQAGKIFDDKLNQLDNIILEQRLTIVVVSTLFIVMVLIGFSYLQMQRRKLVINENQLMDTLLNKKNQLLADVSHELGTPLTVLKLQVESLKDDLEEDVQATYDALDNKLTDLENLIGDIYQLAQSDIGALQLKPDNFNFNQTLIVWQQELSQFVNINKLSFEIDKNLPSIVMVNFDKERIKQVFTNLLSNSIKYTHKPGQVKLHASLEKNMLRLSIEDSAPGVSSDHLKNIFERLYRIENSRSREAGGSGLGLAICKSLIEAHQGQIYAEQSSLGGLKIIIKLPYD